MSYLSQQEGEDDMKTLYEVSINVTELYELDGVCLAADALPIAVSVVLEADGSSIVDLKRAHEVYEAILSQVPSAYVVDRDKWA